MATVSRSYPKDHYIPADPVIDTLMTRRVVAILPGVGLIDALRLMDSARVRHLPVVVEDGQCVGLLAEIDMLRRLVSQELVRPASATRLTAGEVCRRPAPVVPVWCTRATAAQVMLALGSDAVVVLDNERPLGIVTAVDIAASLVEPAPASM